MLNASPDSSAWLLQFAALYSKHFPAIAIGSLLLGLAFGSAKLRKGIVCCLVAMAVAWCLTRLIRWGMPLERPYEMGLGTLWVEHGTRPRFPSLHATVSFAFACGISLWCAAGLHARNWKLLAWTVAIIMGWSRIYIGVHLPFDVLAGLVVGIASVYIVQMLRTGVTKLGKSAAYWYRQADPWVHRK